MIRIQSSARLSLESRLKLQGGEANDKASAAVSFCCPIAPPYIFTDSVLVVLIFAFQTFRLLSWNLFQTSQVEDF